MKINVNRKDAIWGYISTIFSMCINFIMLPFILKFLNGDEVGLYYVFASLSTISVFFDFGFSPCFARSISYAWSGADTIVKEGGSFSQQNEPNFILLKKLIVVCKILYFIIACLALIVSLSIGTVYVYSLVKVYQNPEKYMICWIIYAISIFFNLLYGYYSVLLRGVGAIKYSNIAIVISRIIQIIICVVLLMTKLGLLSVAIAYLCYGLSFRILAKYYFGIYEGIKIKLSYVKIDVTKKDVIDIIATIWPNTWKEGIVTLSNYIANQGTTIICSMFFSLYDTGLYSLTVQLVQAVVMVSSSMYNTFLPALQSAYSNRDYDKQKRLFSAVIFTYVAVFIFGMCGLILLGKPVVRFMKPEYELNIALLIGVGIYQFILKFRNCYATYFSSTNRVIYYKAYLVSAVLSIVCSVIFLAVVDAGVWGMVIVHVLVQLSYNAWYWTYKAHKEMNLTFRMMIKMGFNETLNMIRGK